MKILQPPDWPRPRGYSNGVAAKGSQVFLSGIVGWNRRGEFESKDFAAQTSQALKNIVEILAQAGARAEDIVRMTWYVVDRDEYTQARKQIGAAYGQIIGQHYPAMTVVEVSGLVEPDARLEIEVTAIVPD